MANWRFIFTLICCFLGNIADAANQNQIPLSHPERELLQQRLQHHDSSVISNESSQQLHLLKSPSRPIAVPSEHLDTLIQQMQQAALTHHGLAITSVQIGIPVRVVLMDRSGGHGKKEFQAFINPELLFASIEKIELWERCLSLPDEPDHLTHRAAHIAIRYQKSDGQFVSEDLYGLEAGIFQQELDHLNGILLSDVH
jgi:peptide deformylase